MDPLKKQEIALRYWLLGRGYNLALEAMEFAAFHHNGFRKDGVTPEFSHQIAICHYVRTLPALRDMEKTLTVCLLHDVSEDYGIARDEQARRFGEDVATSVWAMTKEFKGVKRNPTEVFASIAQDPYASIGKGADRGHNFNSMVGVFNAKKQLAYVAEGEEFFLPMIKKARRLFPDQEAAYENIKHLLTTQMALVKAIHGEKGA
jgi:(p)ppGpp synthase/HD superfamily hydrolase